MEYTKIFKKLGKNDACIAGGKGASLGEMMQNGIPVPDGFVVLAETFNSFIKETDLEQEIEAILSKVNHEAVHTIDHASESIQGLILSKKMPQDIQSEILEQFSALDSQYVAVRSSATAEDGAEHAWAGQLDSYLNTTEQELLTNVQRCWASLFTPRAIFYRFEKGLDTTKISVAVVIQKMVNSEKSGIAFSVHPVTEDRNQIIIEAGYGLGEAVVSGSITPDSYVVTKNPRKILDINISEQTKALYRKTGGGNEWIELGQQGEVQVLTETEIQELSSIVVTIENHYGFPCDIEWAYEDNTFYVVQSRPITTLSEKKNLSDKETETSINLADAQAVFTLSYSRDTTLFIQELWSKSLIGMPAERYGWQNPYLPLIAHYENEGVVEIWQNMMALGWLLDKFYEENIKSSEFVEKLFAEYTDILLGLKEIRSNGLLAESNIQIYCEQVSKAIFIITTFIYIGTDERTPDNIKDICVRARELEDLFSDNDLYIRQSLKSNFNLTTELASVVLASEFNNLPKEDILKNRVKNYLLIDGQEAYLGKLSDFKIVNKKLSFIITEHEVSEVDKIMGQTAFGGYAKGIVKILKKHADIKNVNVGDILVSPMTTPDFLIAMKKATAFVTDEGGITCHAAIVARELNKPCIIGTKFATQILKDGDLVEVDADNGIVRILNKSQDIKQKSDEWEIFLSRPFTLFGASFWYSWYSSKEFKDAFGINLYNANFIELKKNYTQCLRTKKELELFEVTLKHLAQTENLEQIRQIIERGAELNDVAKEILSGERQHNMNLEEQGSFIREVTIFAALLPAFILPHIIENEQSKNIIEKIEKLRSVTYYPKLIENLLIPTIQNNLRAAGIDVHEDFTDLLTFSEALNSNFLKVPERVAKRQEGHFFIYENNNGIENVIMTKTPEIYTIQSNNASKDIVVKGQVAQSGKVKGKVKVVFSLNTKEVDFAHGDILVAASTSPELLPLMKIAGAFITDEGGIGCHAAIIARELKNLVLSERK